MQFENGKEKVLTDQARRVSKHSSRRGRVRVLSKVEQVRTKMKTIGNIGKIMGKGKKLPGMESKVRNSHFEKSTSKFKRKLIRVASPFVPSTPHNTSQYLISNYAKSRKEQLLTNVLNDYTAYLSKDLQAMMLEDILSVDDICITGGSMKGKIEEMAELADLAEFQQENFECTESTNCSLNYFTLENGLSLSQESTSSAFSRRNSLDEVIKSDYDSQINSYKLVIQKQHALIETLNSKIGHTPINQDIPYDPC